MPRLWSVHLSAERHLSGRAAWLRAAVLGANDGLISTSALVVGVAEASSGRSPVLIAGIAGLTAGALSMAAGEYVSVSSQRDAERADLKREERELATMPEAEIKELTKIYERRGLSPALAEEVAQELSKGDRLAVHARDELSIDTTTLARPVQASIVSALSFVIGAVSPIIVVGTAPYGMRVPITYAVTLVGLVVLGSIGAHLGGAPRLKAAIRVLIGGALALVIATGIGRLTGHAV